MSHPDRVHAGHGRLCGGGREVMQRRDIFRSKQLSNLLLLYFVVRRILHVFIFKCLFFRRFDVLLACIIMFVHSSTQC